MNIKPTVEANSKISSNKLEFPLVVEAWKETSAGKAYLEASTVVDEDDELQRFGERWSHHKLVTRPLTKKEKKARGIEDRQSWFVKLFS
jgi:hypothetical protein